MKFKKRKIFEMVFELADSDSVGWAISNEKNMMWLYNSLRI